jgi:hypothetical protein
VRVGFKAGTLCKEYMLGCTWNVGQEIRILAQEYCKHVQLELSTLIALAELYAFNPKVNNEATITKAIYDSNDTPGRHILAFLTMKLFPASSKNKSSRFH